MLLFLQLIVLVIIGMGLFACENESDNVRVVVARVGEDKLYKDDLQQLLDGKYDDEDSLIIIRQFIDNWIQEMVVLQKAEEVLSDEVKDVDRRLEDYRRSLLVFSYEQRYVQDRLDTVVSDEEIQKYYDDHKEDFLLKDYIVKVVYGKFKKSVPNLENVQKWYKFQKDDDLDNLLTFTNHYAETFLFDTAQWVYYSDILRDIPLDEYNPKSFIRNKRKVTFEDENYLYYLNIFDYRMKDAESPISLEKEKITEIILNYRSTELRKRLRQNLLEDAKSGNRVELLN